jgi:L-ascorbate metabolism protein UlaG (beta-lactamase superfamily)
MKTRCLSFWIAGILAVFGGGGLGWLAAQDAPTFTRVQPLGNGEIALTWNTSTDALYRIEVATNLAQWQSLLTVSAIAGSQQLTDSAAPYLEARYYRARRLGATNVLTGDHLTTSDGEVVFHPVNHASIVMKWGDKMIYNDPVGSSALYQAFPKADLILVSHSHSDHFNAGTIEAVRTASTVIIAPQAVYNAMNATLRGLTTVLVNGASIQVLGLTIEAVPAYNLTSSYHPKGTGNGYVLNVGGRRIYMSGDTEDIPEMLVLTNIDVAFLCMNIPYTMPVEAAADAVRAFRPRVVYPYHYRNSTGTFSDLNEFKLLVGQDLGVEVRLRQWY